MERMITMLLRRVFGRAMKAGTDRLMSGGSDPSTMTPEARRQMQSAQKAMHQTMKATRLARRLGRF